MKNEIDNAEIVDESLRIHVILCLGLFAFAWILRISHDIAIFQQYNWLFDPRDYFNDFRHHGRQCRFVFDDFWNHEDINPFPFNSPTAFVFGAFSGPARGDIELALRAWLGAIVSTFMLGACILFRALSNTRALSMPRAIVLISVTILTSYPFQFLIARANPEWAPWLLIMLGMVSFARSRHALASILWGTAISLKFVYAPILVLLFARKQYRSLLLAPVTFTVLTIVASHLLGPTILKALAHTSSALHWYQRTYILGWRPVEYGYTHSMFELVKRIAFFTRDTPTRTRGFDVMYPVYVAFSTASFSALYLLIARKKSLLNQLFFVTCGFLLVPPISSDYRLVHIYIPWGIFVHFLLTAVRSNRTRFGRWEVWSVLFPCVVIFTPLPFSYRSVDLHGQIKTLALLWLSWRSLRTDMSGSLLDGACHRTHLMQSAENSNPLRSPRAAP